MPVSPAAKRANKAKSGPHALILINPQFHILFDTIPSSSIAARQAREVLQRPVANWVFRDLYAREAPLSAAYCFSGIRHVWIESVSSMTSLPHHLGRLFRLAVASSPPSNLVAPLDVGIVGDLVLNEDIQGFSEDGPLVSV